MRLADKTRKLNRDRRFDAIIDSKLTVKEKVHQKTRDMTPYWHDFKIVPIYRASQIAIGWGEEFCARYDASAKEYHSHVATAEERKRQRN